MNPSDIKTITLRVNSTDAKAKLDELERRLRKANDARHEAQHLEQAIGEQIAEARRRQEQLNTTLRAGNHTTQEARRLKADLKKATQELTLLERKQTAARKDAARHLAEATRTEQRIEQTRGRYAALEQTLAHLGRATAPQLREAIRTLERTLGSGAVERGTQEWAAFEARLRECNRELRQLERNKQPLVAPPTPATTGTTSTGKSGKSGNALAAFGDKWIGLTGVLNMGTSLFNNLTASASALVREYAEMDERLADVRKYTGLAERDVSALNDAFRRMDTRTPREQLNALAADAGRLGIQSREGVQEFVEAADMINVALGQDLGEDAVKQIGKLTQLFEVDKTLGLKQGMLATASVINELAQSSSAAEPYIMEFTARLSGVGHTAGIAQPKIMALAAVLDQSMVGVEKGATALQNILTALFRKPADMAAVAGLKVQEFTRLLRTDANAALLAFVEGLKHTGGMDRIAPILDQLKLNGSGATQVLTALAANLDNLRTTQQQATAAFAEGTSVQREFAAANSTTQAQLEKTEKRMKEARIAIGRAFAPIAERVLSASAGTLQALAALLRALIDHRRLVLVLAAAWAAYAAVILRATIAARLHAAATLLVRTAVLAWRAAAALSIVVTEALRLAYFTLTGQTMAAASAQMALSVAMAATPIGALLALISLAVVAYNALSASISSTEAAEQSLEGVRAKARQSVEEERTKIELLRRAAMDETLAMDERRKAVDRLNAIIPHYNAQIDTTTGKYRESKAALDDYLDSLRRKYELEGAREALTNLSKQIVAAELEEDRSKAAWQEQRNFNQQDDWTNLIPFVAPYRMGKEMYRRRQYAVAKNERATLQAQREAILARYGRDLSTAEATGRPSATTASEGAAYTAPAAKTSKSEAAERERRRIAKAQADIDRQAEAARQAAILRYQTGETDLLAHRERLLDIERDTLVRKRDIYQAGTVEHTRAQADIDRLDREHAKKHQDWSLEVLDREQKDELAALDHRAAATLMKDEDVQRERNRITLDHLRRRADLLRRYGRVEEHAAAEQAYAEESARQRLEQERKWAEAIRKLREDYARKSAAEVMAIEQQTLETARRKGLVDEETYQKLLRRADSSARNAPSAPKKYSTWPDPKAKTPPHPPQRPPAPTSDSPASPPPSARTKSPSIPMTTCAACAMPTSSPSRTTLTPSKPSTADASSDLPPVPKPPTLPSEASCRPPVPTTKPPHAPRRPRPPHATTPKSAPPRATPSASRSSKPRKPPHWPTSRVRPTSAPWPSKLPKPPQPLPWPHSTPTAPPSPSPWSARPWPPSPLQQPQPSALCRSPPSSSSTKPRRPATTRAVSLAAHAIDAEPAWCTKASLWPTTTPCRTPPSCPYSACSITPSEITPSPHSPQPT